MSITCWNVQLSIITTVTHCSALDWTQLGPKNRPPISELAWIVTTVPLSLIDLFVVVNFPHIAYIFKNQIFWKVSSSEWRRSQGHLELPECCWCGSVLKPLEMPIDVLSLSLEAMTIK